MVAFNDLREFIKAVDEIKELRKIDDVDPTEIGAITSLSSTVRPAMPAILFDRVKGFKPGFRVLVNMIASRKRSSLLYGISETTEGQALVKEWKEKLSSYTPVPPVEVTNGPVRENVLSGNDVDVTKFPNFKWHPKDYAPMWSYAACIMKDPETGFANIGMYRTSIYDRQTLGMHIAVGHDGQTIRDRWWQQGKATPVAICLGAAPYIADASTTDCGFGESEYDYAGWIRGKPIEVIKGEMTGLPIPATAEIVFEGEIPTPSQEPLRVEGPWGEGSGYYCEGFPSPVVKVKRIYHRDDPIVLGTTNGVPPQRGYIGGPTGGARGAALAWIKLEKLGLPGVRGVGSAAGFLVCSITQLYPGHVKRVADALSVGLAGTRPPIYLMMVDDDIDPSDARAVTWAMNTRCDPAEQVAVNRRLYVSVVNPRVWTPEMRQVPLEYGSYFGQLVVDACKPFHWKDQFNEVIGDCSGWPAQVKERVRDKYKQVIGWQ